MGSLKDSWKSTGVGLGHAFKDLGKSIIKTAAVAAEKVDDWANKEDDGQSGASNTDAEGVIAVNTTETTQSKEE